MNRTRWKMMIGALGLSLGGLAAVAGVPAANGVSCAGPPSHTVARVTEPPAPPAPWPIEMPTPAMPQFMAVELPAPPTIPSPATIPYPIPVATPTPTLPPVRIEPIAPQLPTVPTPSIPLPVEVSRRPEPLPVPDAPKPVETPKPTPIPAHRALPILPAPESPAAFTLEAVPPVNATPVPAPVPAPTPATPVESAKVAERKLKVILAMGDERPRFEVRDGDEVYLKVVCDRVEVKSPGEGGASVSTMSATGKVTFVTPGGEGTCDQLAVLPGTGQVVVTGKVTFTYNWGKVETTVTGEKMNFRLGSNTVTPTASQGTSGVTGVPTSFTRTR